LKKAKEPVITLFDDGNCLRVIAEPPGTVEEKVSIDLEKTVVALSATDTGSGKKFKNVSRYHLKCDWKERSPGMESWILR
jgi:HSP20 family molecular chaperone IbpA